MIRFAESSPTLDDPGLRRHILAFVDRNGPSPLNALPRAWPVTGFHLRLVAGELIRDGEVSVVRENGGSPRLAVTEVGRARLAGSHRDP
jgi:hypothetical protein